APFGGTDGRERPAAEWPQEPAYVEISFERGRPTAINGVGMTLVDLIGSLAMIAGAHGVGDTGKSRTSAWFILQTAHQELQTLVATDSAARVARAATSEYRRVIQTGLWFTDLREALDAFVERMQERVNGVVRLKLFKGGCETVQATPRDASRPKTLLVVTR